MMQNLATLFKNKNFTPNLVAFAHLHSLDWQEEDCPPKKIPKYADRPQQAKALLELAAAGFDLTLGAWKRMESRRAS